MSSKPLRLIPTLLVLCTILALPRLAGATASIAVVKQNNPNEGFNEARRVDHHRRGVPRLAWSR